MFSPSQTSIHFFAKNCLFCDGHLDNVSETLSNPTQLNAPLTDFCHPCFASLPWHTADTCPQCGLAPSKEVCGQCLKNAPFFDRTHAVLAYNYPVDSVLQQFKYQKKLNLTSTLAALMMQTRPSLAGIDYLVPMPMHPKRLKERGFNQSLVLAKIVSRTFNIPINQQACERIIHTPPQASLTLKERIKNIKGAFHSKPDLTGLNLMVIDDVMTSGASLNELAKTLKKAGANQVSNWVIARAT